MVPASEKGSGRVQGAQFPMGQSCGDEVSGTPHESEGRGHPVSLQHHRRRPDSEGPTGAGRLVRKHKESQPSASHGEEPRRGGPKFRSRWFCIRTPWLPTAGSHPQSLTLQVCGRVPPSNVKTPGVLLSHGLVWVALGWHHWGSS